MEFDPRSSRYLIIKLRTTSPENFSAIGEHLPLIYSHYQENHKILSLSFVQRDPGDLERLLKTFVSYFPKADIIETSLSPSPTPLGYIKRFSERLVLHCPENNEPSTEGCIVLRSSLSFGSGFHPTTEICMSLLEEAFSGKEIKRVFDLGTGSGILALAASRLGARQLIAADIDFQACVEAVDNVNSNGVRNLICVVNGTYSCGREASFDLLLANLTTSTILTIGMHLPSLLKKGGLMILSGFTPEQCPEIEKALGSPRILKKMTCEGWVGLLGVKEV